MRTGVGSHPLLIEEFTSGCCGKGAHECAHQGENGGGIRVIFSEVPLFLFLGNGSPNFTWVGRRFKFTDDQR